METVSFDLTTFLLEAINFLILVWLLKWLLYNPVKSAIQKRRQTIQQQLDEAEYKQQQANELKQQYENRLQQWQQEKQQKKQALEEELEQKRQYELQRIEREKQQQQQKLEAQLQKTRQDEQLQLEKDASELACRFASRLLTELADKHLENKLIECLLHDLSESLDKLKPRLDQNTYEQTIKVYTAYGLDQKLRQRLQELISHLGLSVSQMEEHRSSELIAGITVQMTDMVFQANLNNELNYFQSRLIHGDMATS